MNSTHRRSRPSVCQIVSMMPMICSVNMSCRRSTRNISLVVQDYIPSNFNSRQVSKQFLNSTSVYEKQRKC